ncbi:MAG: dienelactone hydrolase [Actinomycetia bacterium]|nr:dienelactone hydrolase [Actinomycetes bacterium]MCP4962385.1 dienelactone hydrolase [Actinomycetes bacterium]
MEHDSLEDFTKETTVFDGDSKEVYWAGSGPAVVIMTEMPGITPAVADFARRVVAAGFSVALPDLFGEAGRPPSPAYVGESLVRGCVSKEFVAFAIGKTSPIIGWMRQLAAEAHRRSGVGDEVGIGVVGMCFTGGFSLAVAVDPLVAVGVMSQPSLPLPIGRARQRDLGLDDADRKAVAERAAAGELCAIGLRFTADPLVRSARFEALRELLGEAFIGVEIDSTSRNAHGYARNAHSVLTEEYSDQPSPTKDANDLVIEHMRKHLGLVG